MAIKWQRIVIFIAIVIAHVLVMRLFPIGRDLRRGLTETDIALASLLAPAAPHERAKLPLTIPTVPRVARLRLPPPIDMAPVHPQQPSQGDTPPPLIDWSKEAEIAAADGVKMNLEASRQGAALSRWRKNVMPAPREAPSSTFAWDPAHLHRVESTTQGLIVHLNDRCSVLISLTFMAIIGGCKLGHLPVHDDLFSHMSDVPSLGDTADH